MPQGGTAHLTYMPRLKLDMDQGIAEDLFEVLQELARRATENQDIAVLDFVIPVEREFGYALIDAKRKARVTKRRFTLPKIKNLPQ